MTHTVLVEREEGGFKATPLSLPDAAVTAPTRGEALRALAVALAERLAQGELVQLEVPGRPQSALEATAGLFSDDPDLARQISAEAYAARDAEALGDQ